MKKVFCVTVPAILLAVLLVSLALAENKGTAAAPGSVAAHHAAFPFALPGGDYELQGTIIDFDPGAGVPVHMHGGYVLAIVIEGEIVLKEKGRERTLKTGGSWTENPGDQHSVFNSGKTKARVAVSMLLPKGAAATTVIKQ